MLRTISPLLGAVLLMAATSLFAQNSPGTAPAEGKGRPNARDCSKAKDPKLCEERRTKLQEFQAAAKQAKAACDAKQGDEKRECMRKEICAQAKDPAQCAAKTKAQAEKRQQAREVCKDKKGDEIKACLQEQRMAGKKK